jgi:hypothetical protein
MEKKWNLCIYVTVGSEVGSALILGDLLNLNPETPVLQVTA